MLLLENWAVPVMSPKNAISRDSSREKRSDSRKKPTEGAICINQLVFGTPKERHRGAVSLVHG